MQHLPFVLGTSQPQKAIPRNSGQHMAKLVQSSGKFCGAVACHSTCGYPLPMDPELMDGGQQCTKLLGREQKGLRGGGGGGGVV